jgi:hypothetical protein
MRDRDELRAQFEEEFRVRELEIMQEHSFMQHSNEERHKEIINELIKRHEMMEIKIAE